MNLRTLPQFARVGNLLFASLVHSQITQDNKSKAKDQQVLAEVKEILRNEHALEGMSISPTVSRGVVTLDGVVSRQAAKVLASPEIQNVDGIKTVMNNLTVVGGASRLSTSHPLPIGFTETKTITLPSRTNFSVRVANAISTKTDKANDNFHGFLAGSVRENGYGVLPVGTPVLGRVIEAKPAGNFVGIAVLSIELASMKIVTQDLPGDVALTTLELSSKGTGRGANTAEKTGGGAGFGGSDRCTRWRRSRCGD